MDIKENGWNSLSRSGLKKPCYLLSEGQEAEESGRVIEKAELRKEKGGKMKTLQLSRSPGIWMRVLATKGIDFVFCK